MCFLLKAGSLWYLWRLVSFCLLGFLHQEDPIVIVGNIIRVPPSGGNLLFLLVLLLLLGFLRQEDPIVFVGIIIIIIRVPP